MTTRERVQQAIKNARFDENGNGVDELIAYAYYLGRCTAAKEVCDEASVIFSEQHSRANKCRYKHMANYVVGDIQYIYHCDYDQWIEMFSMDKVK